jgi:hypothetical protein
MSPHRPVADMSDDEFFHTMEILSSTARVANDEKIDPELREMAAKAIKKAAPQLLGEDPTGT